jgi:hypothetical protein
LGCNHHPTEYVYASCLESSSDGQVQTRIGRLYSLGGLKQVGSMMQRTSQFQGPIQYFKREKVRLLFIRSQCLKRLGDFEAALTDLRNCLEIMKSFDGRVVTPVPI